MKISVLFITLIIFAFLNNESFSQGESAVPFLLIQPSPSLSAMGQTGTALATEDPFGFIWNPAQLGYTSQNNNFSFIFYPAKTEWLPSFNLGLELHSLAFNLRYNLKDLIDFPLSVGFGYSNFEINFGEFSRIGPDPTIFKNSKDYYSAYALGVGINYFAQFNIGFTSKSITSILSDNGSEENTTGSWEGSAIDIGLLLNVPVSKLIDENIKFILDENLVARPDFNFSIGYSKSNLGDEVYYFDRAQTDPLPRMDRIGYGISTGFDLLSDAFRMRVFNFSLTIEADDILIARDSLGWDYSSTLSDLKFWKNLVNIEGTNKIVSHIGLKIDLFETISFYTGHFSGRGFDERKTNGYELKAKGLLSLWALWAEDPITDFLRDHFDIRYYNTNYFADHFFETKLTGLAFYFHNINSLF